MTEHEYDQTYELVKIDQIHEHPQNPRRGDVDAIDESIDRNGWYGAVTVQKSTRNILAGNHRYRVAVQRGATEIPVIWRDCDDETAMRILLADNRVADLGGYDEELLQQLLDGLESLEGTGWDHTLEAAEAAIEAADELPPPGEDAYSPAYAVMVICEDEADQRTKYEELEDKGWELRVVAV